MILIDKILVDEKISTTNFRCDLSKCKGACCTFPGEYGAPVLEEEIKPMMDALPYALEYLSEKSRKIIEEQGFVTGTGDYYHTNCINKRDCVFVYYHDDIALCALEKAYLEGKTKFIKPVSCHLFPIRVGSFGGKYLYYEKIKECDPALTNGKRTGEKIYHTVKEALIRSFGEAWYNNYVTKINEEL
ncbi:DUF3109 family protein [Candidatus Kapaibacterium sp.]